MKRVIFHILLSISLINNTQCNDIDKSPSALTDIESEALKTLYELNKNFPSFEKDPDIDIDYCLNILEKQIHILEYKISTKESIWKESLISLGVYEAALATQCFPIFFSIKNLLTRNFKNIDVPISMLKELPNLTFTRSEKKYLNLFNAEKITLRYHWWDPSVQNAIKNLSRKDQENLRFLALKTAIKDEKFTIYTLGGLFICLSIPFAYIIYYITTNHQNDLAQKLHQTQRLYQKLYDEKICQSSEIK